MHKMNLPALATVHFSNILTNLTVIQPTLQPTVCGWCWCFECVLGVWVHIQSCRSPCRTAAHYTAVPSTCTEHLWSSADITCSLCMTPATLPLAGSYFVLSMCDRLWHPDMSEAEALELMEKVRLCMPSNKIFHTITFVCHMFIWLVTGAQITMCWEPFCLVLSLEHASTLWDSAHGQSDIDTGVCRHTQGIAEVKERLVIAPPSYVIKVVDKNGVREVKRM